MSSNPQQNYVWQLCPTNAQADRRFKDFYDLKEELGKGGFGTVRRCIYKTERKELAAKINNTPDKRQAQLTEMGYCVELSKIVNNKPASANIVNFYDSITEGDIVYNMFELATGGDMNDDITRKEYYTLEEAADAFRQILAGVGHMHERGILHRDLKPHNILIQSKNVKVYKVTDFGLCGYRHPPPAQGQSVNLNTVWVRHRHGIMGTATYHSPEVAQDSAYDTDFDIWAVGVILYQSIAGYHPFWDDDNNAIQQRIVNIDLQFPSPEWDGLDDAKECIRNILCALEQPDPNDPNARIPKRKSIKANGNLPGIEDEPFYQLGRNQAVKEKHEVNALQKFTARRQLKRSILAAHWAANPPPVAAPPPPPPPPDPAAVAAQAAHAAAVDYAIAHNLPIPQVQPPPPPP